MPRKKSVPARLAVIDAETDPFLYGRCPEPFAWGFYDGETYRDFWGDRATYDFLNFLDELETKHLLYAHNGGKFDFHFLLDAGELQNPILVINGRITKASLGIHELRDSFSILPMGLAKLTAADQEGKLDIDHQKMEKNVRHRHKHEILRYLKRDCTSLHAKVASFRERFGDQLTIGATAIKELKKLHPDMVPHRGAKHDGGINERQYDADNGFRRFYFGGRVEAFETGEVRASPGRKLHFYDINSSYPKSMRDFDHPASGSYVRTGNENALRNFDARTGVFRNFPNAPYFMRFVGKNRGALPTRDIDGSLTFKQPFGEFYACSHEIKVACKYGLIEVNEIKEVLIPMNWGRYEQFVDTFMAEKIAAKLAGDANNELFSKLILNSAYGKFATNPFKFKEWYLVDWTEQSALEEFSEWKKKADDDGRNPQCELDGGDYELWNAQVMPSDRQFFDVAIAASITSASRAILLEAIVNARRPIYCDTDSLICEELRNVEISPTSLGAWKHEGTTSTTFIAGKKLYTAVLDEIDKKSGENKIKMASKGARLTHEDIRKIALGGEVEWFCDAPNFRLNGDVKFVRRKIRKRA